VKMSTNGARRLCTETQLARFYFNDYDMPDGLRQGPKEISVLEALFPKGSRLFTERGTQSTRHCRYLVWIVVVGTYERLSCKRWAELRELVRCELSMTDLGGEQSPLVVRKGDEMKALKDWSQGMRIPNGETMGSLQDIQDMFALE
jgi:hypothetical protein